MITESIRKLRDKISPRSPSPDRLKISKSNNVNPFTNSPRESEAPPAYSKEGGTAEPRLLSNTSQTQTSHVQTSTSFRDAPLVDPYSKLGLFDTVFLIDDSGSMSGSNWQQTAQALAAIVPICTKYDTNGVDIYFLNSTQDAKQIRSSEQVMSLFGRVSPNGSTPIGNRLSHIFETYMASYKNNKRMKPLNIICITDGEPSDPSFLEKTIRATAKSLDKLNAADRQVGVQFFQVGQDDDATAYLEELDNALVERWSVRDMIDTVSWKQMNNGNGLSADGILKAVMGAVDKKLDRKRRL